MKDSEFIELLNLYLDHEISAADAARLEAEVQSNPNRRRVYQQYCRMQKGCKMLAQDFASDTVPASERKVVAFEEVRTSSRRSVSLYVVGTLTAAAACVAFVFVSRGPVQEPAQSEIVAQTPAPLSSQPSASAELIAATTPPVDTTALSLRNSTGLTIASMPSDPNFAWMQDFRLDPLQVPTSVEQVRFEVVPPTSVGGNRTYTSGNQPLPSDVKWTAVRFQR